MLNAPLSSTFNSLALPTLDERTRNLTEALAEPLSFRNDYMGMMQEVYRYDDSGKKTHVNARLKQDLTSFARTWFKNLKDQGFLSTANRERLA